MNQAPKFLYHTVLGNYWEASQTEIQRAVENILAVGLLPKVTNEWKGILPARLQSVPIVWLSNGIYQGFEVGKILQVIIESLNKEKLFNLNLMNVEWWVYEGVIQPQRLHVFQLNI